MSTQDFIARPPYAVIQPGAYSAVDASLLSSPNVAVGAPIPAVLGVTQGGAPDKPMYFSSAALLRQIVRGGAAYTAARFILAAGAPQVCVVRAGNSVTRSTLALAGATSSPITLTSIDYGTWTTSIKVKVVATGPVISITYTDALGVVYTEVFDLTSINSATTQNIIDAINGNLIGFAKSQFVSAAITSGTLPLTAVSSYTALAGGTDGTSPASGDWTAALTALETEPVDLIVPATGDAAVHAQCLTHCQAMSTPQARRERVQIVGGVLAESVAQAVARQASLQSARSQLVYPGIYDFDENGNIALYDPFYAAAKIAGMHAALPDVATSLVHQLVPAIDVETPLSTVQNGAIDQLLRAGVTPLTRAPRAGIWVVDSLTGYSGSDQTFRDLVKVRAADYVAQIVRHALEQQYVGGKTLNGTADKVKTSAAIELGNLVRSQIIRGYQTPTVDAGPGVNAYAVGLPVMLLDTTKYIFISIGLQPSSAVQSGVVQDATV